MSLKNRRSCCVEREGSQSVVSLWAAEKQLSVQQQPADSNKWPDAERLSTKHELCPSPKVFYTRRQVTVMYKSAKTIKMRCRQ